MRDLNIFLQERPDAVFGLRQFLFFYIFIRNSLFTDMEDYSMDDTVREQEMYEEMALTPEMIKSIRTLCATCLRHFVEAKAFKIALVPSADRSMDTCTVCQTRRGHDYVVMHR
uniref:Uncharacterized protein n=2 Tax=Faecalibacterium prausnitzii TaxID=853 RepID=A0A564TEL1_9FIRM|nr:Uncharacterised protein [Faecalibacterium prausnitzii]